MSLCEYSSERHSGNYIIIENNFINEYLPLAPTACVKVYLYGLYLCYTPSSVENTLANMKHVLSMETEEIKDAFEYWQSEGLVQCMETDAKNDLCIKYLPIQKRVGSSKKRSNKYAEFNSKLQALIKARMITPTEYNEYYTLIESYHLDSEALLKIVEYCVRLKGDNIGYPYILTVSKNFINDGLVTAESVGERLSEHEEIISDLNVIIKAMGKKFVSSVEDRAMYIKWTKEFGFELNVIKSLAESIKTSNPSLTKLDTILQKYYRLKIFTINEIKTYTEVQTKYTELAKTVTRTLGLYYENLDTVVENYILVWLKKGYDEVTITTLAHYCLKRSIRTLEGMDSIISKFYKLGIISTVSLDQYIEEIISSDNEIQKILDKCNILRSVNSWDRDMYHTWTYSWNISNEIVLLAAEYASGKSQPIQYLNKILSGIYEAKITTIEEAKKYLEQNKTSGSKARRPANNFASREYDKKEIDAMFDKLDNIEI